MSNFGSLTSQELLRLLCVSILTNQNLLRLLSIFVGSIQEAKRTFLTPDGGDTFRGSLYVYENGIILLKISPTFTLQYTFRIHLCLFRKLRFPEMCSK